MTTTLNTTDDIREITVEPHLDRRYPWANVIVRGEHCRLRIEIEAESAGRARTLAAALNAAADALDPGGGLAADLERAVVRESEVVHG